MPQSALGALSTLPDHFICGRLAIAVRPHARCNRKHLTVQKPVHVLLHRRQPDGASPYRDHISNQKLVEPDLSQHAMSDAESVETGSEPVVEDKRFSSMWRQLFGDATVQVYFADSELNARVYTLDGESGYKIQHKKVGGTNPVDEPQDLASQHLTFPKKARRGEKHGRAYLTETDVRAVRAWALTFTSQKVAPPWTAKAREMNVSEGTLRDIVSRRTWSHLQ